MAKKVKDPGVGRSSNEKAKRFINPDGSFNIKHLNRQNSFSESYEYLISIGWFRFFGLIFMGYGIVNAVFAVVYISIGISGIVAPTGNLIQDFLNALFFSAQTLTTLGYGAMAPTTIATNLVSSIEALIGLLLFSFVTGLLYGRFSTPRANIRFSIPLVLRKHEGVDSIMFRLMSKTTNIMIRPKIEVTLSLSNKGAGEAFENTFYTLNLERKAITYLPTTWTVVHAITEDSPLYAFDREQLDAVHGELLILVSYYDESFDQEVHQTHSYLLKELKKDMAFVPAVHYNATGQLILDHDLLDQTKPYLE